jgi:ADP-ribose pyrophosphatase
MAKDLRMPWKCLDSKVLLDHPRMTVLEDSVRLPSGQETSYLRLAHASDAVTVVCLRDGHILLQREYSYPPGEFLLQFPGGKIEANETPEEAAARELKEESGFTFSKCEPLGWYYNNNRRSDAKLYVVLAKEITAVEKTGGDAEEDIESFWVPVGELGEMISAGEITNGTVLAAWALLQKVLV